jgi:hypothetical protein
MELLIAIGLGVAFFTLFDLVALRFGVDSRDTIGDDHGLRLTPRWQ